MKHNNIRRLIKFYLLGSIGGWGFMCFAMALIGDSNRVPPAWVMFTISAITVFFVVLGFTLTMTLSRSGLSSRWFDTQEELERKEKQTEELMNDLKEMIKIVGDHEAIKLWNEKHPDKPFLQTTPCSPQW